MRKNILNAFLFVFLSFTLISCGNGNLVDETAQNTTPDASLKELLSISAVSQGGTKYKFTPNVSGASLAELTYEWTFGDSGESTEQSPVYTYGSMGMKTVTLTTYKGEEIWKTTSTAINVTDAGSITGTDIIAKPEMDGVTYSFTSRAVAADGGDLEFTWDFDDVEGSNQTGTNLNNVSHEFYQYGRDYNVTLTVNNNANGDTTTTNTVVSTPNPTFSFDVTAGALPGSKVFTPNLSVEIPDAQFTWDFGDDNTTITTSQNPNAEHYYGNYTGGNTVTVKCTVTSSKLATPLEFIYENINITINFQLFGAAYEVTSADQLTYKYSVKGAFQGEDTTKINEVSYRFIYPDGAKSDLIKGSDVYDGETVVQGQSYAEDNHTYTNYMRNYNVKVEAVQVVEGKETVLGTLSDGLSHNYVAPQYTITSETDTSNPFIVSFTAGGKGFYPLKGAVYKWNFGDEKGEVSGGSSISNTYTKNGKFNVTLKVTSPNVTFDNAYTASTTATVNESISNVSFECNETDTTEWLKYRCTTNATSSTGTLIYTWKVNNQVVQEGTNAVLERTFEKYNTTYNIGLTVKIDGTTISENAVGKSVTTPKPVLEINGSNDVLSGIESNYALKFKVTRNGQTGYVDLTSPTVRWSFGGTDRPQYNDKLSVDHAFIVNDNEDKTVVRVVNATVTSSILTGNITATKNVSVTKPEAEMTDIENLKIACVNDSAWNTVKQKCTVTFSLKSTSTGKLEDFDVSIVDADNLNQPQIVKQGQQVPLVLNWPGTNVAGNGDQKQFTITGKVYKTGKPNNALSVTTTVTVRNYIDYVLFPLPDNPTQGGTGTKIGVYSCGYNSFYGEGNGLITTKGCNEGNSVSGKTLNLGSLLNGNNQAQEAFTMTWKVRIPNVGEKTITSANVSKGGTVPDSIKKFDITSAFNGVVYAGDVYNSNNANNMFSLEISGAALSKPLKVWYNGNNKTSKGNRLRILAPIQETSEHSCKYSVSGKTINGEELYVKFRAPYFNNGSSKLRLSFGGNYRTNTNQTRYIYGSGNASIDSSNQTVGIKGLSYTEYDGTVSSITANSVNITVTLMNSMSGGTYEYKNVYKGINCAN